MKTKHSGLKQFNRSALIRIYRKADFQAAGGEYIRGLFRPFHKAHSAAVQNIFNSGLNGLFLVFDPVKINMADLFTAGDQVFIHQRKCWTAYGVLHLFDIAERMYKTGFTSSHMAMHRDHPAIADLIPEPGCGFMYVRKVELVLPFHMCKIHENPLNHPHLNGILGA